MALTLLSTVIHLCLHDCSVCCRHVRYCYVCSVTLADIAQWVNILAAVHQATSYRYTHGNVHSRNQFS